MIGASRSLPHYWVDAILTTAFDCRRFYCESEALAFARVYARLPNAELVIGYALLPEGRKIIFEWSSEAEAKLGRRATHSNPARRTSQ
jgi:hypothetical protein